MPNRAKTYHAVYDFVQRLLPRESDSEPSFFSIQDISFPPHEKDDPSAPPPIPGKGFTFIKLSRTKDVDYFLRMWPWRKDKRPSASTPIIGDEVSGTTREASETGFKCLSKGEWDKLKEEYLALQRRLLEKTLVASTSGSSSTRRTQSETTSEHTSQNQQAVRVSDGKARRKSRRFFR